MKVKCHASMQFCHPYPDTILGCYQALDRIRMTPFFESLSHCSVVISFPQAAIELMLYMTRLSTNHFMSLMSTNKLPWNSVHVMWRWTRCVHQHQGWQGMHNLYTGTLCENTNFNCLSNRGWKYGWYYQSFSPVYNRFPLSENKSWQRDWHE